MTARVEDCPSSSLRVSMDARETFPISLLYYPRLIALDKNPGVRPMGIEDTVQRIITKAVLSVMQQDIQEASGCLQMCGDRFMVSKLQCML